MKQMCQQMVEQGTPSPAYSREGSGGRGGAFALKAAQGRVEPRWCGWEYDAKAEVFCPSLLLLPNCKINGGI